MTDQTKNPYYTAKWCVIISGLDNVLAAHSYKEAVEKCQQLNNSISNNLHRFNDENYPLCWATISLWDEVRNGLHNPSETNWENAFN